MFETFTHKGWVGLCPVYVQLEDFEDATSVIARSAWLEPWLTLNEIVMTTATTIIGLLRDREVEPVVIITSRLEEPYTIFTE